MKIDEYGKLIRIGDTTAWCNWPDCKEQIIKEFVLLANKAIMDGAIRNIYIELRHQGCNLYRIAADRHWLPNFLESKIEDGFNMVVDQLQLDIIETIRHQILLRNGGVMPRRCFS